MNNNLLNIIKEIIAKYGDTVFSEPKRVSAFFADMARDEPKPHKNSFVKCLEYGFIQALKSVSEGGAMTANNSWYRDCMKKKGWILVCAGKLLNC